MNYGIWIIALAAVNLVTVFSGFPTGSKRTIIVVTTVILLGIGSMLRAIEVKRKRQLEAKKRALENLMTDDMDQVAKEIAHDVEDHVEEEIEHLTNHEHHTHEHPHATS